MAAETETAADRVRAMVADLEGDPAALAWPYQLTKPSSVTCRGVVADLKAVLEEAALTQEYTDLFQRLREAEMRGIRMWQAAGPGRELTHPDRANLVVWLLEQLVPDEPTASAEPEPEKLAGLDICPPPREACPRCGAGVGELCKKREAP